MPKNKALKKARRAAYRTAAKALETLTDAELDNVRHEAERECADRLTVYHEARRRMQLIVGERARRKNVRPASDGTMVGISDHAVVRYLERVKGMDVVAIRDEIIAMAERSGKLSAHRTRRKDEVTGVTIGMDEDRKMVTTVLGVVEEEVLTIPKNDDLSPRCSICGQLDNGKQRCSVGGCPIGGDQ